MKATDLMIGDYVFWDWVTHKVDFDGDVMTDRGYKVSRRIIKSSSVNECGITFKSLKDGSPIYVKEEDLNPIPITPEILEKNFGEEVKIHPSAELCYLLLHKEFKYSIILYKKENSFRLDISDQSTFSYIKKQVNYVHELQHALRLCGIEKEIEL